MKGPFCLTSERWARVWKQEKEGRNRIERERREEEEDGVSVKTESQKQPVKECVSSSFPSF